MNKKLKPAGRWLSWSVWLGLCLAGWQGQVMAAAANQAPSVTLVSPGSGLILTAPANLTLMANAHDGDGSITKVEYQQGASSIGGSSAVPYQVSLNNLQPGTYRFTAKVTDNQGASTTSTASVVTVKAGDSSAPTVSLLVDRNVTTYAAPASFAVNATVSYQGTGVDVSIWNGSQWLGTPTRLTDAPGASGRVASYSFQLPLLYAGAHSVAIKAVDRAGNERWSVPYAFHVTANKAPTVSLTSPVAGARFTAPATVTITAAAADSDGTVSKVEYYNGATLLGSSTASPYSFSWTNVAAGTYSVTAKATDNKGTSTTSAAVSVTVGGANKAPTVSLTSPVAGATFTAPATMTITAAAADSDGTVSKVEYYNGATLLGSSTASPYSFSWTNVGAGVYSVTAKATDNKGASTTSTAVNVTVGGANKAPTVSLTSPATGATFTAPATVMITATAADSDGTVSKVEYYNGATLLGTSTVAPYSFSWTAVAAGTYSVTAKATDNKGASTTSSVVSVTVGTAPVAASKLYFVHPDHLGSPRLIADQSQKTIWRWENEEAFGLAGHQEDPDSDGTRFTFNLRFEGQYHDQESGLRHNRFRDYDPSTGRYVQADPIGLDGGIGLYGYVSGNPLSFIDPMGLAKCGDAYENPGHHDPSGRGPNPYNSTKSTLPENHEALWEQSRSASDGNRWTKVGDGKKAEYHRFQNDGNGNYHWNGSTDGVTARGEPRAIKANNVPKEVKRW